MCLRNLTVLAVALLLFLPATSFANHEVDTTTDEEATLLLSSTSTTTTVVVGGIILTIVMATDADSMEKYLEDNAVALQRDLSLGAGDTVDDLALAFQVSDDDRAAFGKIIRQNREELLALAEPEHLDTARAEQFVQVLLTASTSAGIVDVEAFDT